MNIAAKPAAERLPFASGAGSSLWTDRTVFGLLLASTTLFRLLVASRTGLSDTEAYYAQWARFPDLSYYDHPPLVAWTTWAINQLSSVPWTARVGPILYAALFSALLYRLGSRLFSPRAGLLAVVIVTAIPGFAFVGFLLNPEALLAPLWVLFLLLLEDLRTKDEAWRPLAIGAVIGVAFLAKYTAILAVPVTVLYVAGAPATRRWLRRPSFYLGGVLALALTTPVLVWNYRHGWPSLQLHLAERVGRLPGETLSRALARVASGQLFIFHPLLLPAFVALLAYAIYRSRSEERYRFLATASLPVLAFLLFVMVRVGDSEPHWPLVGYVPLAIAGGGVLDESSGALRRVAWGYLRASLLFSAAVLALYAFHVGSPASLPAFPSDPNADPLTETLGWPRVHAAIDRAAAFAPGAVVVGAHNVLCGHIQSELEDSPPVYCASSRRTEFDFIERRLPSAATPVVFVNSDHYPDDPALALPRYRCARVEDVDVERGGRRIARYRIHECVPSPASER